MMQDDQNEARGWLALERTANVTAGSAAIAAPTLFIASLMYPFWGDVQFSLAWLIVSALMGVLVAVLIVLVGVATMFYFRRKYGLYDGYRDNRH